MADRYAFQSPFSRGSDPWFRVGSLDVTTTTAATALAAFGILLRVAEGAAGSVSSALILSQSALTRGQLWRFFTWPIPPDTDFFWALLGMIFFFMIGSQFENMLGRRAYTTLILSLLLVPGILGVLVAVGVNENVPAFGLSLLFLGVAAGFSAAMPQARSFFNIPFWAVVAFIFFVQFLSLMTARSLSGLIMLLATGFVGLVVTKSLGFAEAVTWIPTVPLPGSTSVASPTPTRTKTRSKRSRNKAGLKAVPSPNTASDAEIDALLDQVSSEGINSLTKQQKQTLERHSKEMKRRRDG
jgi:hypothetical protein